MIPKRVTLENFLSFGARQDIAFDDGEPLWVVGGPNGVGKSAVFDAITYCLFGAHRGGKNQGMDDLVRHGENGFFVQFEFDFNGTGYCVTRNHKLKGRPTARVEQQTPAGDWKPVGGINGPADVKAWAERTLGLPVEAFAASVLLRQGQADEILTATGAKRLETLKKIIGAERYEALSKKVHDAAAKRSAKLDALVARRNSLPPVTPEQVAEAGLARDAAEDAKTAAEREKAAAAERVTLAKQWARYEDERAQLAAKLAAADERAAEAAQIQQAYARFEELAGVLPTLQKLIPVRDALPATEAAEAAARRQHAEAVEELAALTTNLEALRLAAATHREVAADHARQAKAVRADVDARTRFLAAAEQVATLDAEVRAFAPTLDEQARTAAAEHTRATAAEQQARDDKTALDTRLHQAREDERRVADVQAGVECSRCGQVVNAEHAARERAEVADTIRDLTAAVGGAAARLKDAAAVVRAAKAAHDELAKAVHNRNQLQDRLADRRRSLEAIGGTSDAAQLRAELGSLTAAAEKLERAADAERTAHNKHDAELKATGPRQKPLDERVRQAEAKFKAAEKKLTTDAATRTALTDALPAGWAATTAAELQQLLGERDRLTAADAGERYKLWQQDATRREGWAERLREIEAVVAALPAAARVPAADAERQLLAATQKAKQADASFGEARDEFTTLTRQAKDLEEVKEQIAAAESEVRVHDRLDELLGKKHLQRELVRTAEAEIVRLANGTVRNLSAGDLSIELDHAEDGDDAAFALKVRRDGSPPIDVAYLSGSQKFRVAVAVALAIGRFAAGQARPLECVIIDEGFGSLDKDGLQATAEELNNLKEHLRRIILVSHQDDFTSHFPVVYQLRKTDAGTVAEKRRRE